MPLGNVGRLCNRLYEKTAAVVSTGNAAPAEAVDENVGYIVPGVISVIVPVLEIRRPWTLRHGTSKARSVGNLLADLRHMPRSEVEVIVVFNRQGRDVLEFIQSHTRIDKYCVNSTNVGVSRAWNMGAMLAEGEYLCFSNDDVELGPHALSIMQTVMAADASIGEVGPAGGRFLGGVGGPRVGMEQMEDADEISGFLFMTKRAVFDLVGGFDVRFTPAGYEEIDFSFKIRRNALRCCVIPGLEVKHHNQNGVSLTNHPIRFFSTETSRLFLHERNRRVFCEKWAHLSQSPTNPDGATGVAGKNSRSSCSE
jgi:GT2 family glycosyltransferase